MSEQRLTRIFHKRHGPEIAYMHIPLGSSKDGVGPDAGGVELAGDYIRISRFNHRRHRCDRPHVFVVVPKEPDPGALSVSSGGMEVYERVSDLHGVVGEHLDPISGLRQDRVEAEPPGGCRRGGEESPRRDQVFRGAAARSGPCGRVAAPRNWQM